MKQNLLFILFFLTIGCLTAQTFSDDFESYTEGAKIAASSSDWKTWSNGSGDDAPISTAQAKSGTKSLKFKGAAGGGPADIISPFGGSLLSNGGFDLSFYVFFCRRKQRCVF